MDTQQHPDRPNLEDANNMSSTNTSRHGSTGGLRHTVRPPQKVKFSMGGDDEGDNQTTLENVDLSQLEAGLAIKPVPQLRAPDSEDVADLPLSTPDWTGKRTAAAENAQHRASRLASRLSHSAPGSHTNSVVSMPAESSHQGKLLIHPFLTTPPVSSIPRIYSQPQIKALNPNSDSSPIGFISPYSSPPLQPITNLSIKLDDIPLDPLEKAARPYDIQEDTATDDDSDVEAPKQIKRESDNMKEARRLIRTLTHGTSLTKWHEPRSGAETPAIDKHLHDLDYVPAPEQYKPGILGAILSSKLSDLQRNGIHRPNYNDPFSQPTTKKRPKNIHDRRHHRSASDTPTSSNHSSGRATPSRRTKWYDKSPNSHSTSSMATLLAQASVVTAAPAVPSSSGTVTPSARPPMHRSRSSGMISSAVDIIKQSASHLRHKSDAQQDIPHEIVQEVAEIIARRKYLTKLCAALMMYGAPTHRLEEYMRTSARALLVEAEFLYMPGSMLCCFVDSVAYTTQVEMVRHNQGVDLGKFKDVFSVYKCVIHDKYGAEEGLAELNAIIRGPDLFQTWFRILAFGIAAVTVSPWAFSARPIDFAPIFVLGSLLGVMQLCIVPMSEQFSHVFEVAAAVVTSFVARALGSIMWHGQPLFCFSAMAQSSIALILPGYIILSAALELQSRNMVSGSVRMVFAIIYTLFLGFGLLIGTTIFGLIYTGATSDVTCNIPVYWQASLNSPSLLYVKFLWVPIFTVCLAIINQAKWRQMPVMTLIAFCGYQANFWVSTRIANNIQVANAIGAFVIGSMANLYSRFFHGLAAAAMLPAIFVQVPSGLAASGSLVAGITSANQITGNATGISIINNGTQGFLNAQNSTAEGSNGLYGGTIFNVGYGMVQVAIGISVGLYLSALVVYPYGKRKSGLFSF